MTNEQQIQILLTSPLFSRCTPSAITGILSQYKTFARNFSPSTVISAPDRYRRELSVLLSGRIRVSKGDLVLSELSEGMLFGAGALFNDNPYYPSTLTALTDCTVLSFSQETLQQLIERYPQIRDNYIRYLTQRVRFLSNQIDALSIPSGAGRLISYLHSRSDQSGRVKLDCTMAELAGRLNMSRATLYRELEKLESDGVLSRKARIIQLHSPNSNRPSDSAHDSPSDPTPPQPLPYRLRLQQWKK